eukprot:4354175-Prymnesium_polylepis.1
MRGAAAAVTVGDCGSGHRRGRNAASAAPRQRRLQRIPAPGRSGVRDFAVPARAHATARARDANPSA